MRQGRGRKVATATAALLLAGCTGASWASRYDPCPEPPAGEPDGTWRLVATSSFSFCVPGDWRPVGRHRIAGSGGFVEWDMGDVLRPDGGERLDLWERGSREQPPVDHVRRQTVDIAGTTAQVWMTEWRGDYYTGAQWREPAGVYLLGRSPTREAAELQLRVIGTVRFPPEAGGR